MWHDDSTEDSNLKLYCPATMTNDRAIIDISRPSAFAGKSWLASGIFLFVLGIYIFSSAGRIDIIDGQVRYEVSYNWIKEGRPVLRDPWIKFMGYPGRNGVRYGRYGAPASIFAMPLVRLGQANDAQSRETSRFLFSLTSAFFGAGTALLLFLFFLELGRRPATALIWTMVSAFTTLLWPSSTSTFDNAQHAFFVTAAAYLGFLSSQRSSKRLAVVGGLSCAFLIAYQEYFLLLVPALAVFTIKWREIEPPLDMHSGRVGSLRESWLITISKSWNLSLSHIQSGIREPGENRDSGIRFLLFSMTGVVGGFLASLSYNYVRFGSLFETGKNVFGPRAPFPPVFGNPIAGLATVVLSPGKSVLLYSPPIILSFIAIRHLRRKYPQIAFAIIAGSILLVAFISCIAFAGGDWCWGPRYLVPLLPLWALALPFVFDGRRLRRDFVLAILGIGLLTQVLALSVENQRFFFERGLRDFFWAEDPWFYFKHSALLARPAEAFSLSEPLPARAHLFTSVPMPDWSTYSILGPPPGVPRALAPQWMQNFKIYYLPRPWPLWMPWIRPVERPIRMQPWILSLSGMVLAGIGLMWMGLRSDKESSPVEAFEFQETRASL